MMNSPGGDMPTATRAAGGRLAAATAALQRMLAVSQGAPGHKAPRAWQGPLPTIDGVAEPATSAAAADAGPAPRPAPGGPDWLRFVPADVRGLVESCLPAGLPTGLPDFAGPVVVGSGGYALPDGVLGQRFPAASGGIAAVPDGARFLSGSFSNQAGTRPYKLYVPSGYDGRRPVPLIVMLHGCTQSPDDFAAGTGMNGAAEEQTCLVVYPGQTTGANAQKCWKWFSAEDQRRGAGEPSLIAGITRQVMQEYAVDPRRVYVAGLSAGGAAAAVMGETYPDLYAAIGVHSGLACGAARDLPSALAAMRRGGGSKVAAHGGPGTATGAQQRRIVPAIVFHGDRDATVSPRNADAVVAQSVQNAALRTRVRSGQAAPSSGGGSGGGRSYSCTVHLDETGQAVAEQWVIHGAGHAWSGGSAAGSYTDPHGPDATHEMLRFFQEHPRPARDA